MLWLAGLVPSPNWWDSNPILMTTKSWVDEIEAQSYSDTDPILDTPILLEEVEDGLNHLKKNSSGGPDMLSPQHLFHSGPLFRKWIFQVFNILLALEAIPSSFKDGIIIPIYKERTLFHRKATEALP